MLRLLDQKGIGKSLDPSEVARDVVGPNPDHWGAAMTAVRRVAVRLAREERIVILRKGRPADPDDFKGVYRLTLPAPEATEG